MKGVIVFLLGFFLQLTILRVQAQTKERDFRNAHRITLQVVDTVTFSNQYFFQKVFRNECGCYVVDASNIGKKEMERLLTDKNIVSVRAHEKPHVEAAIDFSNQSFNRITKAQQLFPSLTGALQKISVKEENFDETDIDLIGRSFKTSVTPTSISQHATTMSKLIGGAGNSFYKAKGVAPQVNFTASSFLNLFPDAANIFSVNNIQVQNHSYGVGIENYYGDEASAYDQQVSNNPTLTHVFSSGNSGKSLAADGTYKGLKFANLTGNFKQAKNVIVVSAVDSTLAVNDANSRGPAFDGRLKPELTAYGQGGTSEAAALASGTIVLINQLYKNKFGVAADASMVKALLIATADDIGTKGIDYFAGYGSVNAFNALKAVDLNQFQSVTLVSNTETTVPITISTNAAELRVAVAWTDPASPSNASKVLVNDIDAWLLNNSQITLPWVLRSSPHLDSLLAPATRKADHLNNVEYITFDNPTTGTYQLHLKAPTLSSNQIVSVAYWIKSSTKFEWDYPLGADILEGGKRNLLTWQATPNQIGDLYEQRDNGPWTLVQNQINLNSYYYYKTPNVFSKAKLKMVIGGIEYLSNDFVISPNILPKVEFLCADSVGLSWTAPLNASSYKLYQLNSNYLSVLDSTTKNFKVIPTASSKYFSVAPVGNVIRGLKSQLIDYSQQGVACFLNAFSAERINNQQVQVATNLSSWYGIKRLELYKTTVQKNRYLWQTIQANNNLNPILADEDLVPGLMTYQVHLIFNNGIAVTSPESSVLIEEKGKVLLYPNPVSSTNDLNVLSEGVGALWIYDLPGRRVLSLDLTERVKSIDISSLPNGLYTYQLIVLSQVKDQGRLIKF